MQLGKCIILRGSGICDDFILLDGELCYERTSKTFYVGDGENVMSQLKQFNNLVAGDDGKIYAVSVDKNGIPHAIPTIGYNKRKTQKWEYRVSD